MDQLCPKNLPLPFIIAVNRRAYLGYTDVKQGIFTSRMVECVMIVRMNTFYLHCSWLVHDGYDTLPHALPFVFICILIHKRA